jgi:hypothetical protein
MEKSTMETNQTIANKALQELPYLLFVLAISVFLPVVVHVVPSFDGLPMGAHLLPIFYAPLLAIMMKRMPVAFLAALIAPLLNHLITGMPATAIVLPLTMELIAFTLLFTIFWQRLPQIPLTSVVALVIAKLLVAYLVVPQLDVIKAPSSVYFSNGVSNALIGLFIIAIIEMTIRFNKQDKAEV